MREIVSLAQNKNPNATVYRYITRMLVGLVTAILVGIWLDQKLHTLPWITLGAILYVIIGSLVLLIRELH